MMLILIRLLLSSLDNILRGVLFGRTSLEALRVETLAGAGMTTRSAALTTTHGVIDGVHDNAAVAGATAEPARATGLTGTFERVLRVAYGADSCATLGEDLAGLARR